MSAYQISMYWLNQMYIQNVVKANSNLPRSCRCSSVTKSRSGPARRIQTTSRMITAKPDENRQEVTRCLRFPAAGRRIAGAVLKPRRLQTGPREQEPQRNVQDSPRQKERKVQPDRLESGHLSAVVNPWIERRSKEEDNGQDSGAIGQNGTHRFGHAPEGSTPGRSTGVQDRNEQDAGQTQAHETEAGHQQAAERSLG